ncbi:MAG: hypothetical protein Kow001_02330 [Acidobacteriota bacterium]
MDRGQLTFQKSMADQRLEVLTIHGKDHRSCGKPPDGGYQIREELPLSPGSVEGIQQIAEDLGIDPARWYRRTQLSLSQTGFERRDPFFEFLQELKDGSRRGGVWCSVHARPLPPGLCH